MSEQRVQDRGSQIVARIGFAQRWLARARRQCLEGDLPRGLLTLVLADAEMRHALEVGTGIPARSARRPQHAMVAVGVLVVAGAMLLLAGWWSSAPAPTQSAETTPIVTLTSHASALFALIPLPPPTGAAPGAAVKTKPVWRALSRSDLASLPHAQPQSLRPAPPAAAPAVPAGALTASGSTVPLHKIQSALAAPEASGPSEGDLIDLVLAAERALRGSSTRP